MNGFARCDVSNMPWIVVIVKASFYSWCICFRMLFGKVLGHVLATDDGICVNSVYCYCAIMVSFAAC